MNSLRIILLFAFILAASMSCRDRSVPDLPQMHRTLTSPVSYTEMQERLTKIAQADFIELSIEGQSVEGRNLYQLRFDRNPERCAWKVFFFAQQHGDEPAGKDALLMLSTYIAEQPNLLPDDVDLWIMPMLNPDGAEKNQRRNANGADLNRDHLLLLQPETQVLHRVFRKIMPHVAVDCHEFSRDSRDYTEQGWLEWPQIMMDCANNPLFDSSLYQSGTDWIDRAVSLMEKNGYHYCRYFVGGLPPLDEQRYSTPETNDARNGLGTYGGLSFIIESGLRRNAADPDADLADRVDAYLNLLTNFLWNRDSRAEDVKAIETARKHSLPPFIPTNYFWANKGKRITDFKIIRAETGNTETIQTPNFMRDMIVKKSVPSPRGYVIGSHNAAEFAKLLHRHGLSFRILERDSSLNIRPVRLLRMEMEDDDLYARYGGRQIMELAEPLKQTFETGSLVISLEGSEAIRAALLLEPLRLYGLYEHEPFRNRVSADGICPVYRIEEGN